MKRPSRQSIDILEEQLESFHAELSTLSKKSPHDSLNRFKLTFINATLAKCNQFLGKKNKPFDEFSEFDAETLPTNSDVTLILSQYKDAITRFKYTLPHDEEDDLDDES